MLNLKIVSTGKNYLIRKTTKFLYLSHAVSETFNKVKHFAVF